MLSRGGPLQVTVWEGSPALCLEGLREGAQAWWERCWWQKSGCSVPWGWGMGGGATKTLRLEGEGSTGSWSAKPSLPSSVFLQVEANGVHAAS